MSETRRNHGLWLGPLVGLTGLASYFLLISGWRELSDTPWLNLTVLAGAITLSASALMRAWREGAGLSRVAGVAGLGVSILCTSARRSS
jgi:hypothetical protein